MVGNKKVEFKDGSSIVFNPNQDKFQNTFFGTLTHLITGRIDFKDEVNGVTAFYDFGDGGKKKNPKDYVKG